jgi:hypothetical protein
MLNLVVRKVTARLWKVKHSVTNKKAGLYGYTGVTIDQQQQLGLSHYR